MNIELNRCPFCDEKNAELKGAEYPGVGYWVECTCGGRSPTVMSRSEVVDMWNRYGDMKDEPCY